MDTIAAGLPAKEIHMLQWAFSQATITGLCCFPQNRSWCLWMCPCQVPDGFIYKWNKFPSTLPVSPPPHTDTDIHRQGATFLYCKEVVLVEVTPGWIDSCMPSSSAVCISEFVKIMHLFKVWLNQTWCKESNRLFSNPLAPCWHHVAWSYLL